MCDEKRRGQGPERKRKRRCDRAADSGGGACARTRGSGVGMASERNPLARATAGLSTLAEEWAARGSQTAAVAPPTAATGDESRLRVGDSMPRLGQRYRFLGRLGEGAFAQLVAAVDEYRPRAPSVAIKIMHRPYGDIGLRVRRRAPVTPGPTPH